MGYDRGDSFFFSILDQMEFYLVQNRRFKGSIEGSNWFKFALSCSNSAIVVKYVNTVPCTTSLGEICLYFTLYNLLGLIPQYYLLCFYPEIFPETQNFWIQNFIQTFFSINFQQVIFCVIGTKQNVYVILLNIWHLTEFRLVPNQSEKSNYNPNLG